jgi:hypothetical protein
MARMARAKIVMGLEKEEPSSSDIYINHSEVEPAFNTKRVMANLKV